MRNIINISLPVEMAKMVRQEVKKGRYASVSEFFRALLRAHEEDRILSEINESRREIAAGKGKTLRSFKDLR